MVETLDMLERFPWVGANRHRTVTVHRDHITQQLVATI
jgi:hypothetical protein